MHETACGRRRPQRWRSMTAVESGILMRSSRSHTNADYSLALRGDSTRPRDRRVIHRRLWLFGDIGRTDLASRAARSPSPLIAKCVRRGAGSFAEKASEVRGVREGQLFGNVLDGLRGEYGLALGLGQHALADQM